MFGSHKRAAIIALFIPVVAGGFLLQSRASRQGAQLLDQVMSLVSDRFVDTLPTSALYERAARGLIRELNDPYSELLSPRDLKQFQSRTGGRYGGIGMQIEEHHGWITVTKVFPHTPAERGGVREGDRIVQVDTASTRGWRTSQVSDALIGTPGTRVRVRFARPGVPQPIDLDMTRAIVHVPAVPFAITFNNVGYIPLQTFNENSADEVQQNIRRLAQQGVKGIVLDLRGNPGGILDQSLAISNIFLSNGQEIASVKGRAGEAQRFTAQGQAMFPNLPIVILIDQRSASASEIVAGALQDHDRALIVGQTTFGKGLVQSVFNLEGGYALKLTTAKWYTPSGRSIQKDRAVENGLFVEESADTTAETEESKAARPTYRSTGGRVVYGGGGITPDLLIQDDTLTTGEQQLARALAPKTQEFHIALHDLALELSKQVDRNYTVQPAWLEEFYNRLQKAGATVDRATWNGGIKTMERTLDLRIARFAFGDSTVTRRDLANDVSLRKAIELLEKGPTQRELFATAAAVERARQATGATATARP